METEPWLFIAQPIKTKNLNQVQRKQDGLIHMGRVMLEDKER
jgi:hypothetical protein